MKKNLYNYFLSRDKKSLLKKVNIDKSNAFNGHLNLVVKKPTFAVSNHKNAVILLIPPTKCK